MWRIFISKELIRLPQFGKTGSKTSLQAIEKNINDC